MEILARPPDLFRSESSVSRYIGFELKKYQRSNYIQYYVIHSSYVVLYLDFSHDSLT